MSALEATVVSCPGDVNLDMRVNQNDLDAWKRFVSTAPGKSTPNGGGMGSLADFGGPFDPAHPDGLTDRYDREVILANIGKTSR